MRQIVDDEIDRIIENPELGTRKKGDLSHLWVHKFKIDRQEVLLGYSWKENQLELYLLNIPKQPEDTVSGYLGTIYNVIMNESMTIMANHINKIR